MESFFSEVVDLFKGFKKDELKNIVLSFSFLKFTDSALKYSKNNILKSYNANGLNHSCLLDSARYPNGDKIGFYNYSEFDLDKFTNHENLLEDFIIYLNSFSDNIKVLLDLLNTFDIVKSLSQDVLLFILNGLNEIDLDNDIFNCYENLNKEYNLFLVEYNKYFEVSNYLPFINSVFMECYCGYDDSVFIEKCGDAFLINESNNAFDLSNLYLYEDNCCKFILTLSRMIIANCKISNISSVCNLNELSFDLIMSNDYADNSSKDALKKYVEMLNDTSKIIFTISSQKVNECLSLLSKLSKKDILEAVISLPIYEDYNLSAIVLNNNKKENLKNSFILINESSLLQNNEKINNWKFITLKLSKIIKNIYSDHNLSQNLISYELKQNNIYDELKFKNKSKVKGISKRKHMRLDKLRYDFNFKDEENEEIPIELESAQPILLPAVNIDNINFEKDRPNLTEFIKNASNLINDDVETLELSEISELVSVESLDNDSLYFANCNNCNNKLVYFGYELIDINSQDFIKIDLKSDLINLNYLKIYLNSRTGLNEINYATKNRYFMNPVSLNQVRVLIPSMDSQINIVNASEESEEFLKTITSFIDKFQENIFDYEKMINSIDEFRGKFSMDDEGCTITDMDHNWRYAYSKLIWPLAITYLSATRGGFEKTDKARKYLILFEFIAAFNSIVLISGLPDEVYDEYKYKIWNLKIPNGYQNMEFGKWTYFSKILSELYRKQDFTTDFDRKLFNAISRKKINSLLNKVRLIRNEYYHEGMTTPRHSELILDKLNAHLSEIFEILDIYSEYKLIYVLGTYEADGDMVKNRVIHLNGPCKQPIYGYFTYDKMLEKGALFLYNPITKNLLKLNDNLMKFKPIDDLEKHWGIFIFNGYYKKNGKLIAKYKDFQDNEKDYTLEIHSFEDEIIG